MNFVSTLTNIFSRLNKPVKGIVTADLINCRKEIPSHNKNLNNPNGCQLLIARPIHWFKKAISKYFVPCKCVKEKSYKCCEFSRFHREHGTAAVRAPPPRGYMYVSNEIVWPLTNLLPFFLFFFFTLFSLYLLTFFFFLLLLPPTRFT